MRPSCGGDHLGLERVETRSESRHVGRRCHEVQLVAERMQLLQPLAAVKIGNGKVLFPIPTRYGYHDKIEWTRHIDASTECM